MNKNPNILEINKTASSFEYRIQLKMKLCATLHFSLSLCCRLFDVQGIKKPCTCGEHKRVMVVERGRGGGEGWAAGL